MMAIDINILNRKAAEALHKTVGELLRDAVPGLPSPESREMFWRMVKESAEKNLPAPKPERQKRNTKVYLVPDGCSDQGDIVPYLPDVAAALSLISEMEDMIDEIEWDDAADVLDRAQSIGRTIEAARSVTGPQLDALNHMRDAMARWIRD